MKRALILLLLAACERQAGPPAAGAPAAALPGDSAAMLRTVSPAARPVLTLRPHYDAEGRLDTLVVLRGGSVFQRIVPTADADPPDAPGQDVDTVDINLDGFADIRQVVLRGVTGNVAYDWWLFDPDSSRFVRSEEYSRRIGGYVLDAAARRITTRSNGGHAGAIFEEESYEPRGRELHHLGYVRQEHDPETDRYIRATGSFREGGWTERVDTFTTETLPIDEGS